MASSASCVGGKGTIKTFEYRSHEKLSLHKSWQRQSVERAVGAIQCQYSTAFAYALHDVRSTCISVVDGFTLLRTALDVQVVISVQVGLPPSTIFAKTKSENTTLLYAIYVNTVRTY